MHKDEMAVEGLTLHCFLGTKEWEKMTRQEVSIDFKVLTDLSKAARTDQLSDSVNIGAMVKTISKYTERATHQLIESLALEVARILLTEFPVAEAEVTVKKPGAFKQASFESVTIRRDKSFFPSKTGK